VLKGWFTQNENDVITHPYVVPSP